MTNRLWLIPPFFAVLLLNFTNCSKYNSSNFDKINTQQSLTSTPDNGQLRSSCQLVQISPSQLNLGESLSFRIQYSGQFNSFDYSCNQQSQVFLTTNISASPINLSIQNLSLGSYSCLVYGQTTQGQVTCSNSIQVNVISSNSPSPAPSPTPTPLPTPSPHSANSGASDPSFISLHQNSLTHAKSSGVDSNGNYYSVRTEPLIGFKNQYPPAGTPGCVIGYPELRSECDTVNGGFGFSLKGYTYQHQFKVYIPRGTTFFSLTGFLPQSVKYAVAVKLGSPPTRTAPLSDAEYEQAKSAQNYNYDFAKLQNGEERIMVHDGGGNPSFSGTARLSANPIQVGQWIYVRVLNNSDIYDVGAVYEVNRDMYKQSFYQIPFTSNGDPQ